MAPSFLLATNPSQTALARPRRRGTSVMGTFLSARRRHAAVPMLGQATPVAEATPRRGLGWCGASLKAPKGGRGFGGCDIAGRRSRKWCSTVVADFARQGKSPGGISPPGALRTRREPLDSPGSHRPVVR